MLERELDFIDSEVIFDTWENGIAKAKGDFVCLLERDSGISRDAIAQMLKPFLDNPLFRKLVMVAPRVEFDNMTTAISLYGREECTDYHLVKWGSIVGSVVRRSSIKKIMDCIDFKKDGVLTTSYMVSLNFWESGLRVMEDPSSVYSSPKQFRGIPDFTIYPSEQLENLWLRESI